MRNRGASWQKYRRVVMSYRVNPNPIYSLASHHSQLRPGKNRRLMKGPWRSATSSSVDGRELPRPETLNAAGKRKFGNVVMMKKNIQFEPKSFILTPFSTRDLL
jgi:hypothetical protein